MLFRSARHMAIQKTFSTKSKFREEKKDNILAPPILLNRTLALRTLLGITLDPIRSLTIILTLLQPHLGHRTDHRPMIRVNITAKAELVSCGGSASHNRHDGVQGGLDGGTVAGDGVGARRVGAVLQMGVAGNKVSNKEFLEAVPCGSIVA